MRRNAESFAGKYLTISLVNYIIFSQVLVFLYVGFTNNSEVLNDILLNPAKVFDGEIWRVFTFISYPMSFSPLYFLIGIMFFSWSSHLLEEILSVKMFNKIFLVLWIVSVIIALVSQQENNFSCFNIFKCLFLLLCFLAPDIEILLFFLIPVKLIILGVLGVFYMAFNIMAAGNIAGKIYIFIPVVITYLVYTYQKSARFRLKLVKTEKKEANSICANCGKNDLLNPEENFRTCANCGKDLCGEHQKNHRCS